MNNDLIRRGELLGGIDAVIALLREKAEGDELAEMAADLVLHFRNFVERHPGVDAVEVVRCRECKYTLPEQIRRNPNSFCCYCEQWESDGVPAVSADDFCSYGVRREDDAHLE